MSVNYQEVVQISGKYDGRAALQSAAKDVGAISHQVEGLTHILKALSVGFIVEKLKGFAEGLIDLGEHMDNLKQKTGIGVGTLSDFQAAAQDSGLEIEKFEGGLKKFNTTVGKFQGGLDTAGGGFRALGISVKDSGGNLKTTDQLLFEVADAFHGAEDGAAKSAIAVALFGKTGADLIPLLNKGKAGIKGFGIQMSDDFAHQSHEFIDQLNQMGRSVKQLGVDILQYALPPVNELVKTLTKMSRTEVLLRGVAQIFGGPLGQALGFGSIGAKAVTGGHGLADLRKEDDSEPDKKKLIFSDPERFKKEAEAIKKLKATRDELAQSFDLEKEKNDLSKAAFDKRKIALEENLKAEKEIVGFSEQGKAKYKEVTQEVIAQKQALIDLHEAQKQSFGEGAKSALQDYAETVRDVASQTKTLFTDAFKGIEDAFVEFATKGELSFNKLANAIAADLARIAVRQAIIAPLLGLVGSVFNPGVAAGGGSVAGLGGGSSGPGATLAPSAFRTSGGGSEASNGTGVTVILNMDSGTSKTSGGTEDSKKLGALVAGAAKQVIIQEKRPGGLLSG